MCSHVLSHVSHYKKSTLDVVIGKNLWASKLLGLKMFQTRNVHYEL